MALFRASLRTFSRSQGDSATAAAAYRAGIDLPDERLGVLHRFSKRKGVEAVKLFSPPGAPAWSSDIAALWNAAEKAETRSNSRVARELVVSLPHVLSAEQRLVLATEISKVLVERYKMAVMLAMHAPDAKGDQRNHHCHILMSTRELTAAGFGAKVRTLDDRTQGPLEVEFLREMVEQRSNEALEAACIAERVDRRSLDAQAREAEQTGDFDRAASLTREPTLVVGRAATASARRGQPQERLTTNAAIRAAHENDLAIYMAHARDTGRLMPAASDQSRKSKAAKVSASSTSSGHTHHIDKVARVKGKGSQVLNDQAAEVEKSLRSSRATMQSYIEGLMSNLQSYQNVVDAYLALTQREHERAMWMRRCEMDADLIALLRRSVEAHGAMSHLRAQSQESRKQFHAATARREKAQADADGLQG